MKNIHHRYKLLSLFICILASTMPLSARSSHHGRRRPQRNMYGLTRRMRRQNSMAPKVRIRREHRYRVARPISRQYIRSYRSHRAMMGRYGKNLQPNTRQSQDYLKPIQAFGTYKIKKAKAGRKFKIVSVFSAIYIITTIATVVYLITQEAKNHTPEDLTTNNLFQDTINFTLLRKLLGEHSNNKWINYFFCLERDLQATQCDPSTHSLKNSAGMSWLIKTDIIPCVSLICRSLILPSLLTFVSAVFWYTFIGNKKPTKSTPHQLMNFHINPEIKLKLPEIANLKNVIRKEIKKNVTKFNKENKKKIISDRYHRKDYDKPVIVQIYTNNKREISTTLDHKTDNLIKKTPKEDVNMFLEADQEALLNNSPQGYVDEDEIEDQGSNQEDEDEFDEDEIEDQGSNQEDEDEFDEDEIEDQGSNQEDEDEFDEDEIEDQGSNQEDEDEFDEDEIEDQGSNQEDEDEFDEDEIEDQGSNQEDEDEVQDQESNQKDEEFDEDEINTLFSKILRA